MGVSISTAFMAWVAFILLFFEPHCLAWIVNTLFAPARVTAGITIRFKRISLLGFEFAGLEVSLKKARTELTLDSFKLTINIVSALTSWFDTRPFDVNIRGLRVTKSKGSEEGITSNPTNKKRPAAVSDDALFDPETIVQKLTKNPNSYQKVIWGTRLIGFTFEDILATVSHANGLRQSIGVGKFAVRLAHHERSAEVFEFLRLTFAVEQLRVFCELPALQSGAAQLGPSICFPHIDFEGTLNVSDGCVSDVSLAFKDTVVVEAGIQSAMTVKALLGTDVTPSVGPQAAPAPRRKRCQGDIPRSLAFTVQSVHVRVIDEAFEPPSSLSDTVCASPECIVRVDSVRVELSKEAAQQQQRRYPESFLAMRLAGSCASLSVEMTRHPEQPEEASARLHTVFSGLVPTVACGVAFPPTFVDPIVDSKLPLTWKSVRVSVTPDALWWVCTARLLLPPMYASKPAPFPSSLPAAWPSTVDLHVEEMVFEALDLHGPASAAECKERERYLVQGVSAGGVGVQGQPGSVFTRSSSMAVLVSDLRVRADAALGEAERHYELSVEGGTARALARLSGSTVGTSTTVARSVGNPHRQAMLREVHSGAAGEPLAGDLAFRVDVSGPFTVKAVMDGRMRERVDGATAKGIVVQELVSVPDSSEVYVCPICELESVTVSGVGGLDMRRSGQTKITGVMKANMSPLTQVRLLRLSMFTSSIQKRFFLATSPPRLRHPDNPRPPPFVQRMRVFLMDGMHVTYHVSASLRLLITAGPSSSMDLVEYARDMGADLADLAVTVAQGDTVYSPSLFAARRAYFYRKIERVTPDDPLESEKEEVYTCELEGAQATLAHRLQFGDLMEQMLAQDSGVWISLAAASDGAPVFKLPPTIWNEGPGTDAFTRVGVAIPAVKWRSFDMKVKDWAMVIEGDRPVVAHDFERHGELFRFGGDLLRASSKVIKSRQTLANELFRLDAAVGPLDAHPGQPRAPVSIEYSAAMGSHLKLEVGPAKAVVFDEWSNLEEPYTELLSCTSAVLDFGPVIAATLAGQPHTTGLSSVPLHATPCALTNLKLAWAHRLDGLRTGAVSTSGTTSTSGAPLVPFPYAEVRRSVPVLRNAVPMKLVFSLQITTQGFTATQGECLDHVVEAVSLESLRFSPSVAVDRSPALPYWDKVRFQTHGPVRWDGVDTVFHTLLRVFSPMPRSAARSHTFRITYATRTLSFLSCISAPGDVKDIFHSTNLNTASPYSVDAVARRTLSLSCDQLPGSDGAAPAALVGARESSSMDYYTPEGLASYAVKSSCRDRSAVVMAVDSLNVTVPSVTHADVMEHFRSAEGDACFKDRSHALNQHFRLVLVPHLELCLFIDWENLGYSPHGHHVHLATPEAGDTFYRFRSSGLHTSLEVSILGSSDRRAASGADDEQPSPLANGGDADTLRLFQDLLPNQSFSTTGAVGQALEKDIALWSAVRLDHLSWLVAPPVQTTHPPRVVRSRSVEPECEPLHESHPVSPSPSEHRQPQQPQPGLLECVLSSRLCLASEQVFIAAWPDEHRPSGFVLEAHAIAWQSHSQLPPCGSGATLGLSSGSIQSTQPGPKAGELEVQSLRALWRDLKLHTANVRDSAPFRVGEHCDKGLLAALADVRHQVKTSEKTGRSCILHSVLVDVSQDLLAQGLDEDEEVDEDGARGEGGVPVPPTLATTRSVSSASNNNNSGGGASTGAFLHIFDFAQNHHLVRPPVRCLPRSYATPERVQLAEESLLAATRRRRRRSSVGSASNLQLCLSSDGQHLSFSRAARTRSDASLVGHRDDLDSDDGVTRVSHASGVDSDDGDAGSTSSGARRAGDGERHVALDGLLVDDSDMEESGFDFDLGGGAEAGPELRTDVSVHSMRAIYTIDVRDRVFHFFDVVQHLQVEWGQPQQHQQQTPRDKQQERTQPSTRLDDDDDEEEGAPSPMQDRLAALFLDRHESVMSPSTSDDPRGWRAGSFRRSNSNAEPQSAAAIALLARRLEEQENSTTTRYHIQFIKPQIHMLCPKSSASVMIRCDLGSLVGRDFDTLCLYRPRNGEEAIYRKHEMMYQGDAITAYAMRTDVDETVGVAWMEDDHQAGEGGAEGSGHLLLRPIMRPFTVTMSQESYVHVLRHDRSTLTGPEGMPIYREVQNVANKDSVTIPEMIFTLDQEEFGLFSTIVRNVLLAPPYQPEDASKLKDAKEDEFAHHHVVTEGLPHSGRFNLNSREHRYALKTVVERELRKLAGSALRSRLVRIFEYNLGKGTWSIRNVDEGNSGRGMDQVEFGFMGLTGRHGFLSDDSLESLVTLESLWLLNDKPGPQSLKFLDPTQIFKPANDQGKAKCRYCGEAFAPEENGVDSCRHHANEWGEPGFFTAISRGAKGVKYGWTCCGDCDPRAPKCSARRHAAANKMIQIDAKQTAPMLVGETVVNVWSELQVSLFPEASDTLIAQVTSDVCTTLNSYFFPTDARPATLRTSGSGGRRRGALFGAPRSHSTSFAGGLVGSGVGGSTGGGGGGAGGGYSSSEDEDEQAGVSEEIPGGGCNVEAEYVKYMRIGEVKLNLSTYGFGKKYGMQLDRSNIRVTAPPFQKTERIVTNRQLLWKYSKHVVTSQIGAVTSTPKRTSTSKVKSRSEREALLFGSGR